MDITELWTPSPHDRSFNMLLNQETMKQDGKPDLWFLFESCYTLWNDLLFIVYMRFT